MRRKEVYDVCVYVYVCLSFGIPILKEAEKTKARGQMKEREREREFKPSPAGAEYDQTSFRHLISFAHTLFVDANNRIDRERGAEAAVEEWVDMATMGSFSCVE